MGKLIKGQEFTFGKTPNKLLIDKNITLKAKGLYCFIESKPNGWEFSVERLTFLLKESKTAIEGAIKELEKYGWLERKRYQNDKGHWLVDYVLFLYPDFLPTGNLPLGNPVTGKPSKHSNKDISNKEKQEREVNTSTKVEEPEAEKPKSYGREDINELLKAWEETTGFELSAGLAKQRRYATHLIRKYGLVRVKAVLPVLALAQEDIYAPKITDLEKLWFKWNDLAVWAKAKQKNAISKQAINTNKMTQEQKLQAIQAYEHSASTRNSFRSM